MPKSTLAILGYGISFQNAEEAQTLAYEHADMQTSLLPPRLRRRTSVATKMAFSAAERACKAAHIEPSSLPVIFTSALGEAAITDQLCRDIAKQNFPLSPTKFHNSVHNTASGYWSIAVGSQHPAMAMAAYQDSFPLALLEAWSQLHTVEKHVLLVCYEEKPSDRLLPDNTWLACATAFVLSVRDINHHGLSMGVPYLHALQGSTVGDKQASPAFASLPLYDALVANKKGDIPLSQGLDEAWFVGLVSSDA
ncbi:MAG: hypothetical protein COB41_04485 [Proteobacteria bacterium]|nr:MAG: hypothetical protein COB41_04485 [Pseudomonadota bacterium]